MTAPRLVATDLDGTLLDSEGRVSARTRAVLDELDATGVPVVFTTGRPIRWMEELWDAVGGHGLAICSNGAIVYDVTRREVREHRPVTREVGLALAEAVRAAIPGTTFAIEHIGGWSSEDAFPTHPDDHADRTRGAWADIFRDDVVKILAVHRDLDPEDFWDRVAQVVGDTVVTTWSSSFALVEISAAGVTKASTLESLAAEMGLAAEDVVAFGDMPNDLPMLEWAGTSYAMANAHQSVQELADHLAPSNDDDGVATVLAELFDLSR
ncbi:Cof-type HAD-IIB family hydrolase [Nocardioides sp.]|uniref:Cof-type HAD-IIB family hydrolase n=1 Tax=Nocardioides sp. TaxID=35761 RepID=UPI0035B3EBA4